MGEQRLDSANKVAKKFKEIIDSYWKEEISEEEASKLISRLMSDKDVKVRVKRSQQYTGVFQNIMGKRRIAEFEKLYHK